MMMMLLFKRFLHSTNQAHPPPPNQPPAATFQLLNETKGATAEGGLVLKGVDKHTFQKGVGSEWS